MNAARLIGGSKAAEFGGLQCACRGRRRGGASAPLCGTTWLKPPCTHWRTNRTQKATAKALQSREPDQGGSSSPSSGAGPGDSSNEGTSAPAPIDGWQTPGAPSFWDGVNWYCYTALGLLFLVDFTPIGAVVASGSDAPVKLALFQLVAFFLPTVVYALQRGWDMGATFRLRLPSGAWGAAGLCLGPMVWTLTTAAISLKTGVWIGDSSSAAEAAAGGGLVSNMVAAAASSSSAQQAVTLFLAAAGAPAAMEELLFRGFLLTALQQRLGRVDSVMVAGALFALVHLSVEQFFPLSILGFAAGAVAVASGSVWPAVLLHGSYNATGLALGLALHQGV